MNVKHLKRQESCGGLVNVYVATVESQASEGEGVCVIQYTTGRVTVGLIDPESCIDTYVQNGFEKGNHQIPDRIMDVIESRMNELTVEGE